MHNGCLLLNMFGVFFKGTDELIPAHLRCDGKLKNFNLNKDDACALISDVLKERELQREPNDNGNAAAAPAAATTDTMSTFLIAYLKKRYGQDAFAYSYSLNQCFEKFPNNKFIQLFSGILYDTVTSLFTCTLFKNISRSYFKYCVYIDRRGELLLRAELHSRLPRTGQKDGAPRNQLNHCLSTLRYFCCCCCCCC